MAAWLVPIANLVLPAMVTAEVARESVAPDDAGRGLMRFLAWGWWGCLVASFALCNALRLWLSEGLISTRSYVSMRLADAPPTLEQRAGYGEFLFPTSPLLAEDVPSLALLVTSGALLVLLMHAATAAHRRRLAGENSA